MALNNLQTLQSDGTYGSMRGQGGSAHVTDTGPVGQLTTIILDAADADAADADTERWFSSTGAIAFRVVPLAPASALAAFIGLIVGWSTAATNDLTAVNALMATVDTGLTTPGSGGTEVTNTTVILPLTQAGGVTGFTPAPAWTLWDGQSRIKTIAVRSSGADWAAGVVLQVVT